MRHSLEPLPEIQLSIVDTGNYHMQHSKMCLSWKKQREVTADRLCTVKMSMF